MEQFVNTVKGIFRVIIALFQSLLILLVVLTAVAGYVLYRAVSWMADNPAVMLLPPTALMAVWLLKRYVLGRDLTVADTAATIIKRADGKMESLFRGYHKLKLGDRVCKKLSLRLKSVETNLEEIQTLDDESVRLSAHYDLQIAHPLNYYQRGRKQEIDYSGLHQESLLSVLSEFDFDDLYNAPSEINVKVQQFLNDQLRHYGLRIHNYSLAEIVCPRTNERWQRNPALSAGQYWSEVKNFRRRLG